MDVPIVVYKNRTTRLPVSLGMDVSGDTLTSEIRVDEDSTSTLIATWSVAFLTDGTDGELVLTIDNTPASTITHSGGYMDLKRTSGGEPLPVIQKPLKVVFRNAVTA